MSRFFNGQWIEDENKGNGAGGSKNNVLVNFILDRSGSMEDVRKETILGFNNYKKDLLKDTGVNYRMTVTLFGDQHLIELCTDTPLSQVPDLTEKNYRPNGCTPMYDAIGKTVRRIENSVQKDDGVVTVIYTDGHENASREWNSKSVKALIEEKEKLGWAFTYLGVSQDMWDEAVAMGVSPMNVGSYTPGVGTVAAFAGAAASSVRYSNAAPAARCVVNKSMYADINTEVDLKKAEELATFRKKKGGVSPTKP